MAKLFFTPDELSGYFNGKVKHKAYNETVNMAEELCIHAEGKYPKDMIEERRPSEGTAVKAYREKIWKAITKPTFNKVITELNKIRRSADWMVKYDDGKIPPKILAEESLKTYCEEKYPFFQSVTNWVFSLLLPSVCKDANSVIAVMPLDEINIPNEYVRPYGTIFPSTHVIDFIQQDYAVLKATDRILKSSPEGGLYYADVFYIFTTLAIYKYEQADASRRFVLTWQYDHNFNYLPVFKSGKYVKTVYDKIFVLESRLSPMLPRLDEALREYGDLQAEVVQNIYSEKWELVSEDCPTCKGKSTIKSSGFNPTDIPCHACEGTGAKPRGPYSKLNVRLPMPGEQMTPLPPAGFIQKDTSIVTIQDERIDKHEFKALSAINMEYLAMSPTNQSGYAKDVDKDALNNFVNSVAEDIVQTMDQLYKCLNDFRYSVHITDVVARDAMKPFVNVPATFDLLSSNFLESRIQKQKENKGNPIIITAMEEDYVNKFFVGDNALRQKVLLMIKLNPLAGINEEDRATMLSNKGITQIDYVISCNIQRFVKRAINEKKEAFFKMDEEDQMELLEEYAQAKIDSESAKTEVLKFDPNALPEDIPPVDVPQPK